MMGSIRICKAAVAAYTDLYDSFPIVVTGKTFEECWKRIIVYNIPHDKQWCIEGYILPDNSFISVNTINSVLKEKEKEYQSGLCI